MKATEAAQLADVIINREKFAVYRGSDAIWRSCASDAPIGLDALPGDYTPLVPLKQYKVGDVVTFAEALQSGRCFADNILVYKFEDNVFYYWCSAKKRWVECDTNLNRSSLYTYTIVADPSVPQKPTIKDLPTGTIFRATLNSTSYDCVRGYGNNFHLDVESYPISCHNPHWTLTHIKRNGEWEEV